jgi:hypothetical protein
MAAGFRACRFFLKSPGKIPLYPPFIKGEFLLPPLDAVRDQPSPQSSPARGKGGIHPHPDPLPSREREIMEGAP